jgi:hypothetical protein
MSALDSTSSVDENWEQEDLVGSREAVRSFAKPAILAALMSDCGGWLTWSLRQRPPIAVTG